MLAIKKIRFSIALLSFVLSAVAGSTVAAPENEDKPFAEAHILLQLSDSDEEKQVGILNVASNLIKHYGGPDYVDIDVIAFGPGIRLYAIDNPLKARIESLKLSGVTFTICKNTLDTIARLKGKAPEVIDGLNTVQTGVAYIVERVGEGYILVRP